MNKKRIIVILVSIFFIIVAILNAKVNSLLPDKKIINSSGTAKYEDQLTIEFFEVMSTHEKSDSFTGKTWTLPDFTGWSCAEIALALKNINQSYEIVYEEALNMEHNVITKQIPIEGALVENDDEIILYVNSDYGCVFNYKNSPIINNNTIESGEWLYYINNTGTAIKRSRIDMTDSEVLYITETGYISDMLVNEKSIIFIEKSIENGNGVLGKINFERTEKQVLLNVGLSNLLFIDNDIVVLYNPICGTMDFFDLSSNDFYSYESKYRTSGRYALASDQTKHFIGIRNFIYSLEKDKNFFDSNGDFALADPYKNGERDMSHTIYQHDFATGEIRRLFDTKGRIEEIIETTDYWVTAESEIGAVYSKFNLQPGYIYIIQKNTEKRERIDFGVYERGQSMNIAVWKNYIFNFSQNNNSFVYDIETHQKNKIEIPEECKSFSYDSVDVYGNYVYFKLSNLLIGVRYNILLEKFEIMDNDVFK